MAVKKSYKRDNKVYTVTYSGMRGVDLTALGGNAKRYRYSYLENMYKDYEGGGYEITESVPGFRKILSLGKKIHAIYTHKSQSGEEYAVIHAGDSLYRFKTAERDNLSSVSPIITLKDTRSRAFVSESCLFVLDGESIIRISGDGVAERLGEGSALPYVPTTYYNGVAYEQRNLLTNEFKEKFVISATAELTIGTSGLKYKVTSESDKTCALVDTDKRTGGLIYVPQRAVIDGVTHTVTEISENAFYGNTKITKVMLPDTVKRIGTRAFACCTALREVVLTGGVTVICDSAFLDCTALNTLYLCTSVKNVNIGAFDGCSAIEHIYYPGTREQYNNITFFGQALNTSGLVCNTTYTGVTAEIPVYTDAKLITAVTAADRSFDFCTGTLDGRILSVFIRAADVYEFDRLEITLHGVAESSNSESCAAGVSFKDGTVSGVEAITGCTVCESFDGRVFLSGNESLPNTVFYSSRDATGKNNPLYFGVYNYFNDGTGSYGVESMLAVGDSLAVFKSGDDGGGSIYYHTPRETGVDVLPKIYPVSYIHSGICAVGPSVSFFDDPIFIAGTGVMALDKKMINLERSVAVRSHNINPLLLTESLKDASVARWCGYLFILVGEHAYLADSRATFTHQTGNTEYEWYYISGIGTYKNDTDVYKYSYPARTGYHTHEKADETVTGFIDLTIHPDGKYIHFTTENGKRYEVHKTGEKTGGSFSPATCVFATEESLLFFGTESGDVCVFNNDKRGVAPKHISEAEDFDAEDYKRRYGKRIHPDFYSFAGHAPRYALKTVLDDGGFPNITKTTEKRSLTVKMRSLGHGSFVCEAGTDTGGYKEVARLPDSALDFAELDFSAISFSNSEYSTIPLGEKEKRWIEKAISFYTEEYASPFGICSLSYRFTPSGKIKY